jgi:hypothetical protein
VYSGTGTGSPTYRTPPAPHTDSSTTPNDRAKTPPLGTPAPAPGQPDPARPSDGHRGPPTSLGPHRDDGLAKITHILGTVLQRAGLGNSDNKEDMRDLRPRLNKENPTFSHTVEDEAEEYSTGEISIPSALQDNVPSQRTLTPSRMKPRSTVHPWPQLSPVHAFPRCPLRAATWRRLRVDLHRKCHLPRGIHLQNHSEHSMHKNPHSSLW